MPDRRTVKTLQKDPPEIVALEVGDASVQHGLFSDANDSVSSTPLGYPGVDSKSFQDEGLFLKEFRSVALDFGSSVAT